eukprot:scaffold6381_cov152-Isochrysis_galbana.AAC.2
MLSETPEHRVQFRRPPGIGLEAIDARRCRGPVGDSTFQGCRDVTRDDLRSGLPATNASNESPRLLPSSIYAKEHESIAPTARRCSNIEWPPADSRPVDAPRSRNTSPSFKYHSCPTSV